MSTLFLSLGIILAASACFLLVMLLAPSLVPDATLRGYRKTRRDQAFTSLLFRLAWPLIRVATFYTSRLGDSAWKRGISDKLKYAGEPAGFCAEEFIAFWIVTVLGGLLASTLAAHELDLGVGGIIVGTFLSIWLPYLWLNDRADRRLHAVNRGLPQALDLIVMVMGAGLDFVGAVRHVVEKWSDKEDPLCEELTRFLHELSLGKTRHDALIDLADRAPTDAVKAFVNNAVQAERRGTPLVDILKIQADVARTRRFQAAEKVAGRAGVVILLPLMFIFVATILIMFGCMIVKGYRGQLF